MRILGFLNLLRLSPYANPRLSSEAKKRPPLRKQQVNYNLTGTLELVSGQHAEVTTTVSIENKTKASLAILRVLR
jgi:hypothetical protein